MAMLLQIPPSSSLLNITNRQIRFFYSTIPASSTKFICRAVRQKEDTENNTSPPPPSSAEEVTKKYGLEVGLWKILSSKDDGVDGENGKKKSKTDEAKELLAKYGGAYLATSITLSLISFSLCYALVTSGVDVQALLLKVSSSSHLDHIMFLRLDLGLNEADFRCFVVKIGISTNETGEKVGAFALAYAAHKAASPIRFPPTVALTPIVANWIGKKVDKEDDS